MLALYPTKTDEEARTSSHALMRDRTFAGPMRRWGVEQSKVAPAFVYNFSRVHPFIDGVGFRQQNSGSRRGASHGAEVAYAYGTYDMLNRFGATCAWHDADRECSDAMMGCWLAFARGGDPNAEGLPGMAALQAGHRAGHAVRPRHETGCVAEQAATGLLHEPRLRLAHTRPSHVERG
jgi:carboxylesterase type B